MQPAGQGDLPLFFLGKHSMTETIQVPLGDRSYPIVIGRDLLGQLGEYLVAHQFPRRVAVISNPRIDALYGQAVAQSLERQGFSLLRFNVPDGEEYKNLEVLESIYDALISQGFDRGCGLLALGGGVIGDMAGFAAATFLRGIPYVQVPTTLLAQVDSSVGGKTAVNHSLGKNLIGAFYQPCLVLIDVATLATLDHRDISAGLAEVVKYGMIRDREFFAWLEMQADKLLHLDSESLVYAIKKACQIKADIVEIDEKEGSIRAYLNYGHTFAHAIEALCGYGQWKHGEAVASGMMVAAQISRNLDLCEQADVDRLRDLLSHLALPVMPPAYPLEDYLTAIRRDKKVQEGTLSLVLNRGIGDVLLHLLAEPAAVFSAALAKMR